MDDEIKKADAVDKNKPESVSAGSRKFHLVALDVVSGFEIRPGFYDMNGATAIPGGVNFTVHSQGATSIELLLFHRTEKEPYAVIPFPKHYKIGNVYAMIVFKLDIGEFEYAYRIDGPYNPVKGLLFDKSKYLLDPYARAVAGQSSWGTRPPGGEQYKGRVIRDDFDWKGINLPLIPPEDLIIYEMHVRGFTQDKSSKVKYPGTFAGTIDKIPYLKELGINAVELMPVFEFDEMLDYREVDGEPRYNYWGYSTVGFFAPNTSYAHRLEYNEEGNELKELIQNFHANGIEVYLDVVFNHTAEGNENGPFFSFKGFDNNVYYLLTPEGYYYNFSGTGNTINANHPIVRRMITECLDYWVTAYHVDGFRFDLASILGRNEDGSPMEKPPLLENLAYDPLLGHVKLIAEAWDAGGLYQVGSFPSWNRWAEWNGRYRDDIRRFLKGDEGMAYAAGLRISGSYDIYDPKERPTASVNFITCHDGFTLRDLFSYNKKHNESNGWDNTDGADDNNSWNCGIEGETKDKAINILRKRMIRNACTILMCSRGIPMFFSGDEFGNTQFGNNNAYCRDDIVSWLDWKMLKENEDIFEFFKEMIAFRKNHPAIRSNLSDGIMGIPDVSFYGTDPDMKEFHSYDHYVGVMMAGQEGTSRPDILYVACNAYWEKLEITLPELPRNFTWFLKINTWDSRRENYKEQGREYTIPPRTVMVFAART